jgi:hypothetical protein
MGNYFNPSHIKSYGGKGLNLMDGNKGKIEVVKGSARQGEAGRREKTEIWIREFSAL